MAESTARTISTRLVHSCKIRYDVTAPFVIIPRHRGVVSTITSDVQRTQSSFRSCSCTSMPKPWRAATTSSSWLSVGRGSNASVMDHIMVRGLDLVGGGGAKDCDCVFGKFDVAQWVQTSDRCLNGKCCFETASAGKTREAGCKKWKINVIEEARLNL